MTTLAAPEFPVGVDPRPILRGLYHPNVPDLGRLGRDRRRRVTRDNPIAFAILYLRPYLEDSLTRRISFSPLHTTLAEHAKAWVVPGAHRSAWAAPRDAGKSIWFFLVLPLWALAHGHRRYFLAFAATAPQALGHLQNLRAELDSNDLLLSDFPELRPVRNRAERVTLPDGAIEAVGLDQTTLGKRDRDARPDLMLGDDLEPAPARYTPDAKARVLEQIGTALLPMNTRAAVALVGTVNAVGSLLHDVVRATQGRTGAGADRGSWVDGYGFTPHAFPAIVDEGTEWERSLWPSRWSLEELRGMREAQPLHFALNYGLDPSSEQTQKWWTEKSFTYDSRVVTDWRIASVDGAVTEGTSSDTTALAILAVTGHGNARRVYVEHAEHGRWSRAELRARLWAYQEMYPKTLKTWTFDVGQGGNMWRELIDPTPPGVEVRPYTCEGTKRHRAERLCDDYNRRAVIHTGRLEEAEAEMLAWHEKAKADNLIDAIGGGVRLALYGTPGKAPA